MKNPLGVALIAILFTAGLSSCHRASIAARQKVPAGMTWEDRSMVSSALDRRVTYRLIYAPLQDNQRVHVLYLLHGSGGSREEWTSSARIAALVPSNYVLVMPDGDSSYFMNSASKPDHRYEDFIVNDLREDVERRLPVSRDRIDRAVIGNSMGGFAALVLALKHPDMYIFAGAMSPPVDYVERPFSFRRFGQSLAARSIFGAPGSATRAAGDPFALAKTADPDHVPYIFLSAGDKEPLLEPIQRFDSVLSQRHIAHEFHVEPGGHDWQQWNETLKPLLSALQNAPARVE